MKKYFLLVLSVFLCAPLVKAQNGGGEEPPEIIIIWDGGSVGGTPIHHTPAQIPIQASIATTPAATASPVPSPAPGGPTPYTTKGTVPS